MSPPNLQPNLKKFWCEEKNIDSIYSIYLKKISYSYNDGISSISTKHNNSQQISKPRKIVSQSSLQWETRKIKMLQAATLDHILRLILLLNSSKVDSVIEEERNNVAHIIHVLFCTYRIHANPSELMLRIISYSTTCRLEQFRFVMQYWMDNYPEDFEYIIEPTYLINKEDCCSSSVVISSLITSSTSISDNTSATRTATKSDSENSGIEVGTGGSHSGDENLSRHLSSLSMRTGDERNDAILVDELLRLCNDEFIKKSAIKLFELKNSRGIKNESRRMLYSCYTGSNPRNSAILDFDSRYVAQQLTAIDLENFLNLRPYSLLEGTKSDRFVQRMIKNFNLLSRHVIVTILKSHSPQIVTLHWINIALHLRKTKNFNSLKAIIAGLTNESIYRLKRLIWSKIDRVTMSNFNLMATIVDDINNQTILRQTQLTIEGTAKVSIEDESFGTIPYLGTFLTDLNMIDARYQSYISSPEGETLNSKLINFKKCSKQFEILTQVQLLQKNVIASLQSMERRNLFDEQTTLNRPKLDYSSQPTLPGVARLFKIWFHDSTVASMTDKQCYELSLTLEKNTI